MSPWGHEERGGGSTVEEVMSHEVIYSSADRQPSSHSYIRIKHCMAQAPPALESHPKGTQHTGGGWDGR